ncbi:P-loop containing nucleoside triphosphate hydrolase protein [Phlyctochytrium arcticum]|nr:P-loop containing nucleoside triphosphate hydrolase protein [Phlyctochytrium arcticum]
MEARATTASNSVPTTVNTWRLAWAKLGKLMPFLWPKPLKLQLLVVCCFVLLALGRVVNVLVPLQYKHVVEELTPGTGDNPRKPYFCYGAIILYTAFRFLQGGVGLLSSLQYYLWIPVGQYTTREVSVRMLEHLHSLSLQFHINRKTGEVLRVMDRGTSSIGGLLSYLAFNILPVFIDIGLAVIVFLIAFDWSVALVVFITMVLYITCTIWITEWRSKFRREMNELDSASRAKAVDSLLNFETVKYYNNEKYEVNAYDEAVRKYQAADYRSSASLNILNTAQNSVITLGLLVGLLMTGKRVADGILTIGDFVAFLAYLLQLYQPLNWFGTYYRVIQQNFIDMEKMLDLFEEGEAVQDVPNAKELHVQQGKVVFDNVGFAYDPRQPALKGISFEAPAGKTIALVGPSGGGKSTVFRLLFRFYDVQQGTIKIDGQDIRSVKQTALRSHIGVVPQDTVLFNEDVRYNIRYGNVHATDEEVVAAARAAQIHDRIMSFPDGYNTKVGERGLRLSGGEKQRIAIARTILKNPSIILLDEATSALDNTTERLIQDSLYALSANRTTLVIAHRLSTIVDADLILVLKDGQIVERGTHQELLERGAEQRGGAGTYYLMWMRQLGDEEQNDGKAVNGQYPQQHTTNGMPAAVMAMDPGLIAGVQNMQKPQNHAQSQPHLQYHQQQQRQLQQKLALQAQPQQQQQQQQQQQPISPSQSDHQQASTAQQQTSNIPAPPSNFGASTPKSSSQGDTSRAGKKARRT